MPRPDVEGIERDLLPPDPQNMHPQSPYKPFVEALVALIAYISEVEQERDELNKSLTSITDAYDRTGPVIADLRRDVREGRARLTGANDDVYSNLKARANQAKTERDAALRDLETARGLLRRIELQRHRRAT